MGKEQFKLFVKQNPALSSYVAEGTMTWQKFYEMYDMYGENSVIWDPYQKSLSRPSAVREEAPQAKASTSSTPGFKDLLQMVKGLDLATVQKGIDGMQKAIGLVQDFTTKTPTASSSTYEPRPMYKYFED